MKKILVNLLVLALVFSAGSNLTGCGSKEIELTLENYDEYLDFSANIDYCGNNHQIGYLGMVYRTTGFYFNTNVEGASSNYNYNDVKIKVRFYGTYTLEELRSVSDKVVDTGTFDTVLELNTNISGNDSASSDTYSRISRAIGTVDWDYEIVEISGTVSPA